ncbi:MAG TPA: arginine deiminase-related protein, partial [Steroidobacteraceae bacterium]|nr:arginine deiminase-related protein [Steroidobacteraceae bacterium]
LDRVNRIAYACLSPRTDLEVLGKFGQQLDYEIVAFEAADESGIPIYHTNVLMSVGTRFAAICVDAIRSDQRMAVVESLGSTGHIVIAISHRQMNSFAGNILELSTATAGKVIALSQSAYNALTSDQRSQLVSLSGPLVTTAIPTIEALGGGSVRCMLAEIHLPRAND